MDDETLSEPYRRGRETQLAQRKVLILLLLVLFSMGANAQTVLISEIDTNQSDAAEFVNVSGGSVDISSWTAYFYDASSWPDPVCSFSFPWGTVIPPDTVVVLFEQGGGGTPAPGFVYFYLSSSLSWNAGASAKVAVLLTDSAGVIMDFFIARGQSAHIQASDITNPQTIPHSEWSGPAVTGQTTAQPSWHRFGDTDHNDASDWGLGPENIGNLDEGMDFPGLHPRVLSIERNDPSPTQGPAVSYTVYFSTPVTGIEIGTEGPFNDFSLTMTSGSLIGYAITGVVCLDSERYVVALNTGTGAGTLRLDVLSSGGILDQELQPMLADYTGGPEYVVDTIPPSVTSVLISSSPAGIGDLVVLTITFDETMNTAVSPTVSVQTSTNGPISASSVGGGGDGEWISATEYRVTLDRALVALDDGLATIHLSSAQDVTGNVMAPDSSHTFVIDGIVPIVTVDFLLTPDTTPPLSGTILNDDPNATILITLDDIHFYSAVNNGNSTWTLPDNVLPVLAEGTYDVKAIATDSAGNTGTDTTTDELIIDPNFLLIPPYVVSMTRNDPSPTTGPTVSYTVIFNETVTGIETGAGPSNDFIVTVTNGSIAGAAPISVSQINGQTYTVTLTTGTGEGSLRLDVLASGGILDAQSDSMTSDYTTGPEYVVDTLPPTVLVFSASPDPAITGGTIAMTLTFSEPMDQTVPPAVSVTTESNGTISASSATVGGDGIWLSDTEYQVSIDRLLVAEDIGTATVTISDARDLLGHVMLPDNSHQVEIAPPSVINPPSVISMTMNDANPSRGPEAGYTVVFSEPVTGIQVGDTGPFDDFALVLTSGSLEGTTVSRVEQESPQTYVITVNTGTGMGSFRVDVLAGGGILDLQDDPMSADYTSGPEYTIDTIPATLISVEISPEIPGIGAVVTARLIFSESMDVTISPSLVVYTGAKSVIPGSSVAEGGNGAWLNDISYQVDLDRPVEAADNGLATAVISDATDLLGNVMAEDDSTTFFIDGTAPVVTVQPKITADTTPPLSGTIADNDPGATILITLDDVVFYHAINNGDGTWTLNDNMLAELAPGTYDVHVLATDSAGNTGMDSTSDELVIDLSHASVEKIELLDPESTNMPQVRFKVTFSSVVTGVEKGLLTASNDFKTCVACGNITQCCFSAIQSVDNRNFVVTVNIGAGDGKMRLDVLASGGIESLNGVPLPEDYTQGPLYTIQHLRLVSQPPEYITKGLGSTAYLEVEVAGGTPPYSYEWQYEPANKMLVPVGGNDPVLVLYQVDKEDEGQYLCVVSDAYEVVSTTPSYLEVTHQVPAAGYTGLVIMTTLLASLGIRRMHKKLSV